MNGRLTTGEWVLLLGCGWLAWRMMGNSAAATVRGAFYAGAAYAAGSSGREYAGGSPGGVPIIPVTQPASSAPPWNAVSPQPIVAGPVMALNGLAGPRRQRAALTQRRMNR